ncbi:MAG: hypothetical protein O6922_01090 [Chloroflexi bacterium]|nr:hypothetical protein [Chloroflexota bacterium]
MSDLTAAQIERLLAFRGYGNPGGRFWFVGMEEGGSSDITDLRIRADKFDPVEDLAESHKHFQSHNMKKLTTSTWRLMSAVVGRICDETNWRDPEFARSYQAHQLGRPHGETYLAEIFPMPKYGINDWPYEDLFGDQEKYRVELFQPRAKLLTDAYFSADPKPAFVFCYGSSFRDKHRKVFDFVNFELALENRIEWGRSENTVFLLTNFFNSRAGVTLDFVGRLCEFALSKAPK